MKVTNEKKKDNNLKYDLIAELSVHLCNMYALGLKFKNFHWHVKGPNFKSLHDLFEDEYNCVYNMIDDLAKRIRTLGAHVPATLKAMEEISEISEKVQPLEAIGMLENAIEACSVASERCVRALKIASLDCDEVTVDMLVSHQKIIEKAIWKFNCSMEESVKDNLKNVINLEEIKGDIESIDAH